jgi:hypothetical protein
MVKRALLIGINYVENTRYKLNGCINDVINLEHLLIDAYNYSIDNVIILRDDLYNINDELYPSTTNIVRELNNIFEISNENDEIWIHYSGHGHYTNDNNNKDETDNRDEMIISINKNGRLEGILDDELNSIFEKNISNTFVVFDCCNSGTIGDLKYTYRFKEKTNSKGINDDELNKEYSDKYEIVKSLENEKSKVKNIHLLSGSRDDQESYDSFDKKSQIAMGAMTSSLLYIIRRNKHTISLYNLHKQVCEHLISKGFSDQTPCLSLCDDKPTFSLSKNTTEIKIKKTYHKMFMKLY